MTKASSKKKFNEDLPQQDKPQDERALPTRLSLRLKETSIVLEDDDGGDKEYIVRELTGERRDAYMNRLAKRSRVKSAKNKEDADVTITDFTGLYSALLSLAMFEQDDEGQWVAVKESTIQKWPTTVQEALFKEAKRLSGLLDEDEQDEDDKDDEGNE